MQSAVAINTLTFARKLKSAGFNEQQAELQAEAINEALMDFQDKRLEELATKGDLKTEIGMLRAELSAEISELRAELSAEISRSETKLIKWGIALMFAQLAGFAGIINLFL